VNVENGGIQLWITRFLGQHGSRIGTVNNDNNVNFREHWKVAFALHYS